jgi:hypothetical protein
MVFVEFLLPYITSWAFPSPQGLGARGEISGATRSERGRGVEMERLAWVWWVFGSSFAQLYGSRFIQYTSKHLKFLAGVGEVENDFPFRAGDGTPAAEFRWTLPAPDVIIRPPPRLRGL